MNTWHKVIRYFALAFAISIIFSIISVGYQVVNILTNGVINNTKVSSEILKLEKDPNKQILDINVKVAKVNIVKGEKLNATTDSKYVQIEKKNNSLIITEKKHSLLKEHGTVNVTIPDEMVFDAVSFISGVGRLKVKSSIQTGILEISSGVGEATFNDLIVNKKANIKSGVGDFTIKNGHLTNTNLELGIGEVNITAKLLDKTSIESGIGSVNIKLIGEQDDYKITTDKGIGSISVDGKSLSNDSSYGEGSNKISIKGGIGSINVDFVKVR